MIMEGKMLVEIIGIKNGKIVSRFKREVSYVGFDEESMHLDDIKAKFSDFDYDRLKLIVDGEEWINKSFLKIDFSFYELGSKYEFSDDGISWTKMELVSIDTDDELPFKAKKDSLNFGWRLVRELF